MPRPASRLFNVLVVDDEPDVPDLLVEYFRDSGHTVTPVSDGHAAVAEISQNASRYGLTSVTCNLLVWMDLAS
jgi:CheY-like chemotaxis protein